MWFASDNLSSLQRFVQSSMGASDSPCFQDLNSFSACICNNTGHWSVTLQWFIREKIDEKMNMMKSLITYAKIVTEKKLYTEQKDPSFDQSPTCTSKRNWRRSIITTAKKTGTSGNDFKDSWNDNDNDVALARSSLQVAWPSPVLRMFDLSLHFYKLRDIHCDHLVWLPLM